MARKWGGVLPLSGYCDQLGEHEACPHERFSGVQLFRRGSFAILCTCDCHLRCPVGGRREVLHEEWVTACTCPGSEEIREIDIQTRREDEQRIARDAEVFRDVDIGRGRSAGEIQQQILAAYAAHGYEPPSDYSRVSRFLAVGTGRWGTRTIRLLVEAARGLRAAMNWAPSSPGEPPAESTPGRQETARNMQEVRNLQEVRDLLRELAVVTIFFIGAAVGAYFAGGVLRAILIIVAISLFALATWTGLMTLFFIVLARMLRRWSDNR